MASNSIKPAIPKKSQLVVNFSKTNGYFNIPHNTDVTKNPVTLQPKQLEEFSITKKTKLKKKPIPKPRKLIDKLTPLPNAKKCVSPTDDPNPARRRTSKKPIPLPRPGTVLETEEGIYDDIAVSNQHAISNVDSANVYEDASSYPLEGLYDDASSYKFPPVNTSHKLGELSDKEKLHRGYRTCHLVFDSNNKESFPVHRNLDNKEIDVDSEETTNILTPMDYIYPSQSQQIIRQSQLNKSLQYDYACQDISLSTETSLSEPSSTHGVFAKRDYDYAYQHELSSSPTNSTVNHKYYYITKTGSQNNPLPSLNLHSYETIPHSKAVAIVSERPITSKMKPLPDLPKVSCDQLLSSGDDYDEIDQVNLKPSHYVNTETASMFDLPEKMRQRATLLVRGPTKEKLHLSLRKRKVKNHPSIFDMFHENKNLPSSTRALVLNRSGNNDQFGTQNANECDNNYDTIPSEISRTDFDRLLEANGVYFNHSSVPPLSVRRHSLSSSETESELLSLSMNMTPQENCFLQSCEFDKLKDLVYTELRDYRDAGIVHVRSRHQIAQDIQNLTECAPLSPPPLPCPRIGLIAHNNNRLLHQRTGSIDSVCA